MSAILREVHYLKLMGYTGIPETALKMLERNQVFRKYISILNLTIGWYNRIRRTSRDVEYRLIQNELEEIDKLVLHGQNNLDWNSEGNIKQTDHYATVLYNFVADLWNYMVKLHALVGNLQQHLQKSQENLTEIKNILIPFARQPLFERKDGKKSGLLNTEDRPERVAKKYDDLRQASEKIKVLLNQNMVLFEMSEDQDNPKWIDYIDFVDKIILSYLYQTVGCRFVYCTYCTIIAS